MKGAGDPCLNCKGLSPTPHICTAGPFPAYPGSGPGLWRLRVKRYHDDGPAVCLLQTAPFGLPSGSPRTGNRVPVLPPTHTHLASVVGDNSSETPLPLPRRTVGPKGEPEHHTTQKALFMRTAGRGRLTSGCCRLGLKDQEKMCITACSSSSEGALQVWW